jgi:catalase
MKESKKLTTNAGAPVPDNQNVVTAGPRTDGAPGCLVPGETRTL